MKHHHFPCEALNWTWTGQCNFKKLEGDAKWHRIQSVSHTLIFQVFFNITSVLEFVYSHFFTLYLICMWLLFIMPVIKLLFLTIVLPGDFVVARRAFWRETEMAILVARTNLPVWDFQKLASLVAIHRLGVIEIDPSPHHCFRTTHPCAQSVKGSPTEPFLSRSSRQRLGHLQSHFDESWYVCQAVFPEPQSAAACRRVERRDYAHEALPRLQSASSWIVLADFNL